MTPERLAEIEARCEAATELATAFRKVIVSFDPVANSPMTEENLPVKILSDWARKACDTLARRDIKDLREEVKRLLNAHDALVAACEESQTALYDALCAGNLSREYYGAAVDAIDTALALAKGE